MIDSGWQCDRQISSESAWLLFDLFQQLKVLPQVAVQQELTDSVNESSRLHKSNEAAERQLTEQQELLVTNQQVHSHSLSYSYSHTHSLSFVPVVMMKSKELKTKIYSHAGSVSNSHSHSLSLCSFDLQIGLAVCVSQMAPIHLCYTYICDASNESLRVTFKIHIVEETKQLKSIQFICTYTHIITSFMQKNTSLSATRQLHLFQSLYSFLLILLCNTF